MRNKIARMKEQRREKAAIDFAQAYSLKGKIMSTWGPYKSTSGVAKTTDLVQPKKKKEKKELKVYTR